MTTSNPNGTLSVSHTNAAGVTTIVENAQATADFNEAATAFNDVNAIYNAILTGNKAGIIQGGLNGANDWATYTSGSGIAGASLAANGIGAIEGFISMRNAIKSGDGLEFAAAAGNTITSAAAGYAAYLGYSSTVVIADGTIETGLSQALAGNAFGSVGGQVISDAAAAAPFLSIAVDLEHHDYIGAIATAIGYYFAGPVGGMIGGIISDLFASTPPPPWGAASVQWDISSGRYKINATGGQGGDTVAYNVLSNMVGNLSSITTSYNGQAQPGLGIGLIPERMGSISFDNSQFHINTIDAITGQQINPDLSFDTSGNATAGSTYDGTAAYFQNMGQYYANNALSRQALAPLWEVQTAQMQATHHLSNAGLTETERAANLGELAAPLAAGVATETWNPIALDFGGGLATTALSGSAVQFNVDGTDNLDANLGGAKDVEYLHQTAWLNKTDGFLVLDENMNGAIDNGEEMFSDSQVTGNYRGVASLATYDANGDGIIDTKDPVFAQLGVWIDAQGTGQLAAANYHSFSSLGITSLNYRMGTYTKSDNSVHQMGTLNLQANTLGTSYTAAASGIELSTTDGKTALAVTRLTSLSNLQANEVAISTHEDVSAVIQVRGNGSNVQGLLDTDSVSNAPNAILQLSSVQNALGGTVSFDANAGTVTFTPITGFSGMAGFDYTVNAGAYGNATAHVQVNVAQVDHPPVITGDTLQQIPIYGYLLNIDPVTGANSYTPSYTPGYGYGNSSGGGGYANRNTAVSYKTNPDAGTLTVTDQDYPASALTWSIISPAKHGTATVDSHGDWSFTNGQAIGGNDAFVVQVTDPLGGKSQITVSAPLPAAPIASSTGGGGDGDGSGSGDSSDSDDGDGSDGGDGDGGGDSDPLILDLNGTGFHFTGVDDSKVFFQQAGDGLRHQTAWFTGGNGVLAFNKYGNGIIQDSSQINFKAFLPGAANDLQGLAAFDSNHDGVINSQDAMWGKLGVWVDSNNDGVSEAGEFQSLSALGIASINLSGKNAFLVSNSVVADKISSFTYTNGTVDQMANVTLPVSNNVLAPDGNGGTRVTQVAHANVDTPMVVGEGNNLVLGDVGDNNIQAGNGNNTISTGSGNDLIQAGNGNNSIMSGSGKDMVVVGNGNNTIVLGAGAKQVYIGGGSNLVIGGSGNNIIMAGQGNNVLYAGSGNSVLFAEDGANTLVGGTGHNELIAGQGNNIFTDGGGRADMTAGTGSNTFTVTNAQDTVTVAAPTAGTTAGVNTVKTSISWTLGANQQILWGAGTSSLTLTGNNAGDQIIGNGGADTLVGGTGNDTLADSGGAATMVGGGGNDIFVISNAASVIKETASSTNAILKTSVSYTLPANVQTLVGAGNAALILTGGAQNGVTIQANNANDTLIAGSGTATLMGGSGNDIFVVNNTLDVVQAQAAGNTNTIQTSVSFVAAANVQNLIGIGSAAITLTGNNLNTSIVANAGNDTLIAGTGINTLTGGSGNDNYQLGSSTASVLFGSGQSTLVGTNGNVQIKGNVKGASTITLGNGVAQIDLSTNNNANMATLGNGTGAILMGGGANIITTGNGARAITVGNGNNLLTLGDGAQTLILGNGSNTVTANDSTSVINAINAGNGNNSLILGQGNDSMTVGNGSNTIRVGNGNDQITTGSGTNAIHVGIGSDSITNNGGIDSLYFAPGIATGKLTFIQSGKDLLITEGASGGSVLVVGGYANTATGITQFIADDSSSTVNLDDGSYNFSAGDGANTVVAGNGQDHIVLGNGNNTLQSGHGNDVLKLGNGANQVTAADVSGNVESMTLGNGNNIVKLGNGTDKMTVGNGSNFITGTANGGQGADTITLGTGSNTVSLGNGSDTVIAQDLTTSSDTIMLGSGQDSVILGNGNNKIVTADLAGTVDTLTVGNGNNTISVGQGNDKITLGRGSNSITAGNGINVIIAGNGSNRVNLGSGQDTVTLGDGANQVTTGDLVGVNDVITVGNGQNLLTVGNGNNQITTGNGINALHVGNGKDTIVNHGGTDSLYFAPGAAEGLLNFTQSAADLLITEGVNSGSVRIVGGYSNPAAAISQFIVGNGNYIVRLDDGSYNFAAGNGANIVRGGNGNDQIIAGNGSNGIYFGSGTDRIALGDGNNFIAQMPSTTSGKETLTLGNGNNNITVGQGDDAITLGNGNNVLQVGQGNDNIVLGNGANIVSGGNGLDIVNLGSGSNSVILGNGADTVLAQDVAGATDSLTLGNGNDVLTLANGNNVLTVGNGNSQLSVGNGANIIQVGNGINQISTGTGINAIHIGTGNDSITNHGGTDTLYFTTSVLAESFNFSQSGSDLLVTEATSGGIVRVVGAAANLANAMSQFVAGNGAYVVQMDNMAYQFTAGNGNDKVIAGNGANIINLGKGIDQITLGNGANQITTTDVAGVSDSINVGDGANQIILGQGNHSVITGNGANRINAGNGVNTIKLGSGSNTLTLGNANNQVAANDLKGAKNIIAVGSGANQIKLGQGDNNIIVGNGNNVIQAADVAGSIDTLTLGNGSNHVTLGAGNDSLTLGNGNNTLKLGAGRKQVRLGSGADTLYTSGGTDSIVLGAGQFNIWNSGAIDNVELISVNDNQLWFQKSGNNLLITVMGSAEKIIVNNWYDGGQLNQLTDSNGFSASAASINHLVQAMAVFAPPASAQTRYTQVEQIVLAPVLASSWHKAA